MTKTALGVIVAELQELSSKITAVIFDELSRTCAGKTQAEAFAIMCGYFRACIWYWRAVGVIQADDEMLRVAHSKKAMMDLADEAWEGMELDQVRAVEVNHPGSEQIN